jgi:hypothetical protein
MDTLFFAPPSASLEVCRPFSTHQPWRACLCWAFTRQPASRTHSPWHESNGAARDGGRVVGWVVRDVSSHDFDATPIVCDLPCAGAIGESDLLFWHVRRRSSHVERHGLTISVPSGARHAPSRSFFGAVFRYARLFSFSGHPRPCQAMGSFLLPCVFLAWRRSWVHSSVPFAGLLPRMGEPCISASPGPRVASSPRVPRSIDFRRARSDGPEGPDRSEGLSRWRGDVTSGL